MNEQDTLKTEQTETEHETPQSVASNVRFSDLINQSYPLIIDFDMAEKIVQKIHALVKILKDGELNENEYKLLSEITSGLRHPAPISF